MTCPTCRGHHVTDTLAIDCARRAFVAEVCSQCPAADLMPRAKRVCPTVGCPALTDGGRCERHRREHERARGTRQQRGYGVQHAAERARWAPLVATGTVACWRCGEPIPPDGPWDLGHLDDRSGYGGPEHVRCNRATARRGGG